MRFSLIMVVLAVTMIIMSVTASVTPNETPETSTVESTTSVMCNGFVNSDVNYVSTTSTDVIDKTIVAGERQSTTVYGSTYHGVDGVTTLVKDVTVDTSNADVGQSNLDVTTMNQFTSMGGRATYDERIGIDTMDRNTNVKEMLCPFSPTEVESTVSCDLQTVNTYYDITYGNSITGVNALTIGDKKNENMDYTAAITGTGLASIDYRVHTLDSRGALPTLSGNMWYTDSVTASGQFSIIKNVKFANI